MKRSPLPPRRTFLKRTALKATRSAGRVVPPDLYEKVMFRDQGCRGGAFVSEVACQGRLDPHHIFRRGQGGPDTLENLITLCRAHHDWVHQNPLAAQGHGLLKRSGNA